MDQQSISYAFSGDALDASLGSSFDGDIPEFLFMSARPGPFTVMIGEPTHIERDNKDVTRTCINRSSLSETMRLSATAEPFRPFAPARRKLRQPIVPMPKRAAVQAARKSNVRRMRCRKR